MTTLGSSVCSLTIKGSLSGTTCDAGARLALRRATLRWGGVAGSRMARRRDGRPPFRCPPRPQRQHYQQRHRGGNQSITPGSPPQRPPLLRQFRHHPGAHGREVRRRQRLMVSFPQQRQALLQPGRKHLASGTLPEVPSHFHCLRGRQVPSRMEGDPFFPIAAIHVRLRK
jgi:hypothetical protein